jgi:3-hydroxyisobutyrate dehydrogenase-like beta-hydroxyacid dehydrogenase
VVLAPAEEEAPAPEAVEEEPVVAAGLAEELAAAPSTGLDPAVVDEVVNQVLARLSPQVMETIAREIVRPLAEALLKEKLKD